MSEPAPPVHPGSTIAQALRHGALDPLERRILIAHALGLSRVALITQSDRVLSDTEAHRLSDLFQRRLDGEPIAYLTGEREFYGLPLQVTPDVLIPRPETELLVDLALKRMPPGARVLDLGTGSGAIAIAIAHQRPDAVVTAVDASPAALALASQNATGLDVKVRFLTSDWYASLGSGLFDLIVSNPPYIRSDDIHLAQGDLRFEPRSALTDFGDGLSALRTIVEGAPARLENGGWLLMEHGYDQAESVRDLLASRGFCEVQSWTDLAGIARVSGGRLGAAERPA